MTAMAARLILAMLLLPASMALFVLMFAGIVVRPGIQLTADRLLLLWAILYTFIGTYWVLLWRGVVRWTRRRVGMTLLATLGAMLCGAFVGGMAVVLNRQMPPPIGILFGGGIVPIVWTVATVLLWRETPGERVERLTAAGSPAVACPLCGYSLVGLRECRCPECGTSYTIEQLLVSSIPAAAATTGAADI